MSNYILHLPIDLLVFGAFVFTFLGYLIGYWWAKLYLCEPLENILKEYTQIAKDIEEDNNDPADYWKRGAEE